MFLNFEAFIDHMLHPIQDRTRAKCICLAVLSLNLGSERDGATLGKILHLFRLLFLFWKMGTLVLLSRGYCKDDLN